MKTYPPDDLLITVSRSRDMCDIRSCYTDDNGSGYCNGHAWLWWNKWYRQLARWANGGLTTTYLRRRASE